MGLGTNNEPLVSVVITTYNRRAYLKETLDSLQNQTYNFVEIVLIDDGSRADVAKKNKELAASFSKCKYFYKDNTGQPDSRNYGILKCQGEYIGFCDDDDFWEINKLEMQLGIFTVNPKYAIVTGCVEYVNTEGTKTGQFKCHDGYNQGYIFENLLIKNRTASITPLLKREVFDKVGYFNPGFTIAEDWEFWRRVSYYYEFYSINQILAYVRLHPENMSKSRTGKPFEGFMLYRKLTKSLLDWGENKFKKSDYNMVYRIEFLHYRKIMTSHYPGALNKFKFIKQVFVNDFNDGVHLLSLIIKYKFFRWK